MGESVEGQRGKGLAQDHRSVTCAGTTVPSLGFPQGIYLVPDLNISDIFFLLPLLGAHGDALVECSMNT